MNQTLRITTTHKGKTTEWITVIEEGIPVWVPNHASSRHRLIGTLSQLFEKAEAMEEDEPVVLLRTADHNYEICYFPDASLYLCDDLDGRYATLSSLTEALWDLMGNQEILSCDLLP